MSYLSIRDLDLKGKRVFIRVDFNVPLQKNDQGEMEITSDKRIKASLPTIQYALEHGAGVILASHLGRPKGKPNPEMSLKPVAARLEELLGRPVKMAPDCVGPEVEAMKPAPGEVLLLENLRFHAEEEKNDPEFAKQLAALCDVYVNDAFGSAHRAHASTEGMIRFVPQAAAGLLMEQELKYLGMATTNPRAAVRGDPGRRESVGQDRSDRESGQGRRPAADRRRHGLHVSEGAGTADRQIAGGRTTSSSWRRSCWPISATKLMLPVDHVVVSEIAAGARQRSGGDASPTTRSASISGRRRSSSTPR